MTPNEEIITKEQLYKILHISKRRAKFLLDNGYIPCIDTGKKTRRYINVNICRTQIKSEAV